MRVAYNSNVVIEWDNVKNTFIVYEPFTVEYGFKDKGIIKYEQFTVSEGFETDLASIPRWATVLVPKHGHHIQPAVAHDWCYVHASPMTKKFADKLFYDGMLSQGVRKTRASLMYGAVKVGGKGRWV